METPGLFELFLWLLLNPNIRLKADMDLFDDFQES